jgi:hypothetical protein
MLCISRHCFHNWSIGKIMLTRDAHQAASTPSPPRWQPAAGAFLLAAEAMTRARHAKRAGRRAFPPLKF